MKKIQTETTEKNKKQQVTGSTSKNKKHTGVNADTATGAISKVKSRVGHGLANEGTTGTYEHTDI